MGWRSHHRSNRIKQGTGRIEVLARRSNGDAAAFAKVLLQNNRALQLDGRGHGVYERLAPGRYRVSIVEPGLVRTSAFVDVTEAETAHTTVQESKGQSLTLRLRNEHGTPLPFARVSFHISGTSTGFPMLSGDTQPAWFLTDANGELRAEGLPLERFMIKARYGSRQGYKMVHEIDGTLEIVIGSR